MPIFADKITPTGSPVKVMLVIVYMNMMGMPLWAWIVFYVRVLIMLIADLKMFGRKGEHEVNVGEALRIFPSFFIINVSNSR